MPVDDSIMCPMCNGHGWYTLQISDNGCQQAQCEKCSGTGRIDREAHQ